MYLKDKVPLMGYNVSLSGDRAFTGINCFKWDIKCLKWGIKCL